VTGARSTDSDNDGLSDEEYDPKAASEGSLSSRKRSGTSSLFVKLDSFVFSVSSDVSNSDSFCDACSLYKTNVLSWIVHTCCGYD